MKAGIGVKVVIIINSVTQMRHILRVLQIVAERLTHLHQVLVPVVVQPVITPMASRADFV